MPIINKGTAFSNGEQLTATKLNDMLNLATFDQSAADSASTTVNSSGQISVADSGITPSKLSAGAPSWDSNGQLKVNGQIKVGFNSGSGEPNAFVRGSRVGTLDVLSLYSDNDIHFDTQSGQVIIDSLGRVKMGTTAISILNDNSEASAGFVFNADGNYTQAARWQGTPLYLNVMGAAAASAYTCQYFSVNGVGVGTLRGTEGGGLELTQLSDYRLKENVQEIEGATDRVKGLNPCLYTMKSNGNQVEGFIAHELDGIPGAVIGEKDAVDAEGNPEYQSISESKLIPTLTKALQEAIARIEALEACVAALAI
tara:strand:+ start:3140 stop:4075 length:936 start_codon:yes stop_codon:yes gene_type:complete